MENTLILVTRFLKEAPDTPLSFVEKDMSLVYEQIGSRTEHALPVEFELLYSWFEFPDFDVDPINFFGNPDTEGNEGVTDYQSHFGILKKWLNDDFKVAIEKGFLPFASFWGNYDPICFDTNRKGLPLVALDHEAILMYGDIVVIEEIAPSIRKFMENALNKAQETTD